MTTSATYRARLLLAILLGLGVSMAAAEPPRMDGPRSEGKAGVRLDDLRRDAPRRDDVRRDGARPDIGRDGPRRDDVGRDGPRREDVGRDGPRRDSFRRDGPPPRLEPGFRLDSRHRHDRHYPPRGHRVDRLPHHPVLVHHYNSRFYFHSGVWYRPDGPSFVVVTPPIGLGIAILPPYYTTLWVGGVPYYYADEVYYTWRPERREYVVVEPPPEADTYLPPPAPEQLFVYPREGQDEAQMATDRYECHRWAVEQTDFDPVQPARELLAEELEARRADYQRATKACLEARGYSVR
jgi:hypothetical protein